MMLSRLKVWLSNGGTPPQTYPVTSNCPSEDIARECRDITLRASMLMDSNDVDGTVALFTADLEFVKPSSYPEVAIKGAAELRAAMCDRPADFVSRHVCTNQIVTWMDPGRVCVRSYFTHYSGTRDGNSEAPLPIAGALRSVGEYEDIVVQTSQGWRIAKRSGRFVFGHV